MLFDKESLNYGIDKVAKFWKEIVERMQMSLNSFTLQLPANSKDNKAHSSDTAAINANTPTLGPPLLHCCANLLTVSRDIDNNSNCGRINPP